MLHIWCNSVGCERLKYYRLGSIALLFMLLSVGYPLSRTAGQAAADTAFPNIVSHRVQGTANFSAPGSEPFWTTTGWTVVPLAASVSPGGGHTGQLLLKSANDGFHIYVLLRWNDSQGPSYASQTEVYKAPNGTLIPLTPLATSSVKQLFYNSTYYYQDRAAVLWFLGNPSQRHQPPAMNLGTNGAITGGAADIWHWQSNPTDNNRNDTGYPGGYTDPSGRVIYPPDNLSFSEDDYTNMTGFFVTAGSFGKGSPNLDPYVDPFVILTGTAYSFADKTWTIEMVRSLTVGDPRYMVEFATNSSYYAAFAVWQGKLGESSHLKSVSQWYTVTISDRPSSPSVTTTSQGVTPVLAVVVALGTLLVGIVLGTFLRFRPSRG